MGLAEGVLVGVDEVPALVGREGNKDGIPEDELGALGRLGPLPNRLPKARIRRGHKGIGQENTYRDHPKDREFFSLTPEIAVRERERTRNVVHWWGKREERKGQLRGENI